MNQHAELLADVRELAEKLNGLTSIPHPDGRPGETAKHTRLTHAECWRGTDMLRGLADIVEQQDNEREARIQKREKRRAALEDRLDDYLAERSNVIAELVAACVTCDEAIAWMVNVDASSQPLRASDWCKLGAAQHLARRAAKLYVHSPEPKGDVDEAQLAKVKAKMVEHAVKQIESGDDDFVDADEFKAQCEAELRIPPADWDRWHELLDIRHGRGLSLAEYEEYKAFTQLVRTLDAKEGKVADADLANLCTEHGRIIASIRRLTVAVRDAAEQPGPAWTSATLADQILKPDAEDDWPQLREMILTAEDFDFTLQESALLAPRLLDLAIRHRDSDDREDAPAVWSAIRTGASMFQPNDASPLLPLFEPGHTIDTSKVAVKMLGRIYEAFSGKPSPVIDWLRWKQPAPAVEVEMRVQRMPINVVSYRYAGTMDWVWNHQLAGMWFAEIGLCGEARYTSAEVAKIAANAWLAALSNQFGVPLVAKWKDGE